MIDLRQDFPTENQEPKTKAVLGMNQNKVLPTDQRAKPHHASGI